MDPARQIFLLSPANCNGKRCGYLMRKAARFDLAVRLRTRGATIGEVFTFMSGLYFRGKMAYAGAFASAPHGIPAVQVIVPGRGLVSPEEVIDLNGLMSIAKIPVDVDSRKYVEPLLRDAEQLHLRLGDGDAVILLGSIATPKYLEPLGSTLGERLHYPSEFIGRGDMSRGSLMLRHAREGRELTYISAIRLSNRTPCQASPRSGSSASR